MCRESLGVQSVDDPCHRGGVQVRRSVKLSSLSKRRPLINTRRVVPVNDSMRLSPEIFRTSVGEWERQCFSINKRNGIDSF